MRLPRQPRPVEACWRRRFALLARARSQARPQRAYRKPLEHAQHGEHGEHQLRRGPAASPELSTRRDQPARATPPSLEQAFAARARLQAFAFPGNHRLWLARPAPDGG